VTQRSADVATFMQALLHRHRLEIEARSLEVRCELEAGLRCEPDAFEAPLQRILALLIASLPDGCEIYVAVCRSPDVGIGRSARVLLRLQVAGRDDVRPGRVQPLRPVPRDVSRR
jgi:hypothetical protein